MGLKDGDGGDGVERKEEKIMLPSKTKSLGFSSYFSKICFTRFNSKSKTIFETRQD